MVMPEGAFSRRRLLRTAALGAVAAGISACGGGGASAPQATSAGGPSTGGGASPTPSGSTATASASSSTAAATPAQIIERATVPVLCYHQVRRYEGGDTAYNRQMLIIEPARFAEQLDAIKEAGYTTITPDEYLAHLTTGAQLPAKPVILSFDDGKDNQPEIALPALAERGMKGTWFIMTVVVGNGGWTTKSQIRQMADAGMTIGCHTWDHHDVREYTGKDFTTQFDDPRKKLQDLSGQKVETFAYPYGAWNPAALPHLEKAGFTTAFQLDEKPLDPKRPLMTLRRALAVSTWSGDETVAKLKAIAKA